MFTQADAISVLGEFKAMGVDELLRRLGNDVRLAEISAKEIGRATSELQSPC